MSARPAIGCCLRSCANDGALREIDSEGDKNFYESKCATLDRQIDSLVYELYDLTPDEIAIVEGTGH